MKLFLIAMCLAFNAHANELKKHELKCEPENNSYGFSARIEIKQLNTTWSGEVYEFNPVVENWDMPKGCKAPTVKDFKIGGHLDQKFYYHEHEYQEGYIFRMVFLSTVKAIVWVYPKGQPERASKKLHALCKSI